MDIQEKETFEVEFKKTDVFVLNFGGNDFAFKMKENGEYYYSGVRSALQIWQAAKAQAVSEWIEYEKQSPRIDGRYQIFINGEQLAADWESPYGFSSAEDGTAFIQELITHWSVLNNDPVVKAQEPTND